MTDKTGTLTKGVMSLKKVYIAGREWNLNLDKKKRPTAPSTPKKIKSGVSTPAKDVVADAYEKELWELNHGFDEAARKK